MIPRNNYPKRFISAVDKLITAYVKGDLYDLDCKKCAVGNICNNTDDWFNYIHHNAIGNSLNQYSVEEIEHFFGYTMKELASIEDTFMYSVVSHYGDYYGALVDTIDHLAKLDNIDLEDTQIFKEALINKEELVYA